MVRIAGIRSEPISSRSDWLTPERLGQLRGILLGITLFVGLVVWVFHSLAPVTERAPEFVSKLRGVGVLTWIYALVQMLDMRFYHSRFARRRNAQLRLPESLVGWLFGQMLASFGILYYGLVQDLRWFTAGLVILVLSFWVFPVQAQENQPASPPPHE
jgi:hypothetical protein